MHPKISSAKWRLLCPGGEELNTSQQRTEYISKHNFYIVFFQDKSVWGFAQLTVVIEEMLRNRAVVGVLCLPAMSRDHMPLTFSCCIMTCTTNITVEVTTDNQRQVMKKLSVAFTKTIRNYCWLNKSRLESPIHEFSCGISTRAHGKGRVIAGHHKASLTYWGRVMHIHVCASKLTIIGSDNVLAPARLEYCWLDNWEKNSVKS